MKSPAAVVAPVPPRRPTVAKSSPAPAVNPPKPGRRTPPRAAAKAPVASPPAPLAVAKPTAPKTNKTAAPAQPAPAQTRPVAAPPATAAAVVPPPAVVSAKPKPTSVKSAKTPGAAPAANLPASTQKIATPAVKLPAILFEGDLPTAAPEPPATPGHRFELGPVPPESPARPADTLELPESYGTGRLLLAPRDPFWLFAHWDFSFEHLRRFNSRSIDGHLVLRVCRNSVNGPPVSEIHLHPESREWFVNVPAADTAYVADLGYYASPGRWYSVTQSPVVQTPAAVMSQDLSVQFAAVTVEIALQEVIASVQESALPTTPLAVLSPPPPESPRERVEPPPAPASIESTSGQNELPPPSVSPPQPFAASSPFVSPPPPAVAPAVPAPPPATPAPAWTPAQARTFAAILELVEHVGRTVGGSEELLARVRQQLGGELGGENLGPSSATLQPPARAATAPEGISSAELTAGKTAAKPGFWFNVNAELVIYGATEPTAQVTIGGRPIKLRADGTFGYRFALPDGNFELPIVALARDRSDGRAAKLAFTRATEYRGAVGAHPQDPALQPPRIENVG